MNRKAVNLLVCLCIVLPMALRTPVPVAAQEGEEPPGPGPEGQGFSETFDDPQLPGWEHSPEAVVSEGVLQIGPGNFAARGGNWQDFDVAFKLRLSGQGETHVNYRASDNGTYLLVFLENELILMKTQGEGQETQLAQSGEFQAAEETWMDVRITLQSNQHTISVDGTQLLSATDDEPLPAGALVFASHGERTTSVDDLSLQVIVSGEGAEPGEGPVGPVPAATPTPEPAAAPNTLESFFQALSASQGSTIELGAFAVNLLLAMVSSFILSRVYVYWGSSLSNRRKFAANFMLVTVTTTFIILVVRSSVALSLGLVGALSIIRFRTAVKEPEELAYLFFAISLGIGLGDNQRLITLLSLVVVILLIGLARLLRQTQADINLHLALTSRAPVKAGMQQVQETLDKHCAKLRLIRYDENDETLEMAFVVEFRHLSDLEKARAALQELSPKMEISFLDNKGIW